MVMSRGTTRIQIDLLDHRSVSVYLDGDSAYLDLWIGNQNVIFKTTTPEQLLALVDMLNQSSLAWQVDHDEDRNGT